MTAAQPVAVAAAPLPTRPGGLTKLADFSRSRSHELPGVIALAAIAALEIIGAQFILLSDRINVEGIGIGGDDAGG